MKITNANEEGRLSVAQRFGLLALVYKKGDATDLANYRGLAKCSQLYKLTTYVDASGNAMYYRIRVPVVFLDLAVQYSRC